MLFKLIARVIRNPFFLVLLTVGLSVSAQAETITINSLGGNASCTADYQTTSDNRFCVGNDILIAGSDLYIDNNEPQTYEIKADGTNLTSFTLSEMTINTFTGNYTLAGTSDSTGTYLRLYNTSGDEITTIYLAADKEVTTTDMSMATLFGTFSAVPSVARFELVIALTNPNGVLSNFQIRNFDVDTAPSADSDATLTAGAGSEGFLILLLLMVVPLIA